MSTSVAHSSHQSPHRCLVLKQRARYMRHNPTFSEAALWSRIKASQLGVGFRRQVVIGNHIVDFLAPSVGLIVEIDGGYHEERVRLDAGRQRRLERAGYTVLRLSAEAVIEQPLQAVRAVVKALRGLH